MICKHIHHHSAIKTILYVNQKHYNNSSSLSSTVEKSIIKVVEQHHMYTRKCEVSQTFRHMKRRQTKMYVVHPNLGVTSTKRCHMPATFYFIKSYIPQHHSCHPFIQMKEHRLPLYWAIQCCYQATTRLFIYLLFNNFLRNHFKISINAAAPHHLLLNLVHSRCKFYVTL